MFLIGFETECSLDSVQLFQHLFKLVFGCRADFATDHFSAFENQNRWNAGNRVLDGQIHVFRYVHFADDDIVFFSS